MPEVSAHKTAVVVFDPSWQTSSSSPRKSARRRSSINSRSPHETPTNRRTANTKPDNHSPEDNERSRKNKERKDKKSVEPRSPAILKSSAVGTAFATSNTQAPPKPQSYRTRNPAIAFVELNLDLAQERLNYLCRRRRLSPEDAEEFKSTAILKLLEKSQRLERQFAGRSNLTTYFDSVLANILQDYRIAKWGKWRSSTRAKRLGSLAISLERLIFRDRLDPRDAVKVLARRRVPWLTFKPQALEAELWRIVALLPARIDRRTVVDNETVERNQVAEPSPIQVEMEDAAQELDTLGVVLQRSLEELSATQRTVLQLRYAEGLSFAEIENRTGLRIGTLYRQVARTLKTLRKLVKDSGLSGPDVLQAYESGAGHFCIDQLFEATGG